MKLDKNFKFMFKQFKSDCQLFLDLFRSFLRYYGFLKRKSIEFWDYQTKGGMRLRLRRDVWDSAMVIETWWLNEYLRNLKELGEGTVVIDVGAHIGSFTLFIAKKLKKAKILAYEPEPNNFALLKENIKINHLEERVFPFQLAVVGKAGRKVPLRFHPDNLGMHSVVVSGQKRDKRKSFSEAKTTSLRKIFNKNRISRCDLLKMDCEGSEYLILSSTPKEILRRINRLTLEYHPGGDIESIKERLEKSGFETKFDRAVPNWLVGWLANVPLLNAWKES